MKAEIGAQRLADKTDLDEDAKDSSEVHSNSILKYIYMWAWNQIVFSVILICYYCYVLSFFGGFIWPCVLMV